MISPQYIQTYDWYIEDTKNFSVLYFIIPEILNVDSIKTELTEDGENIYVGIDEMPPFLCGRLFGDATSVSKETKEGHLLVTVHKKMPEFWTFFITSSHKELKLIDPKSAFLIYRLFAISPDKNDETQGKIPFRHLQYSAQCGFPPAMSTLAVIYLSNPSTREQGVKLLSIGANVYKDANSMYQLGVLLSLSPDTTEQGFNFMKVAAEKIPDAMAGMGEYLSPLSDVPYPHKNPEEAVEWLQKALKIQPDNWEALTTLAHLMFFGIGIKQDVNTATDLQRKAMEINPKCPPLAIDNPKALALKQKMENPSLPQEEDVTPMKKGIIFGATAAVILGFGAIVYKSLSKKK